MLSLSSPAFAQDAATANQAADTAVNSGEIIVSARRREEVLQDVPLTVNVVTSQEIDKYNLRTLDDIQSVVPGLTLNGGDNGFSAAATVRGVAFNTESGASPTVEFYLNDAPISAPFVFQSLFDVGQFELLRGPQGTLRGRASPSGSITLTTRKPDLTQAGTVFNVTATNHSAYKVDGAFNIPLLRDVLGVRIAGLYDANDGNRVHSIREAAYPQFEAPPHQRTESLRTSVRFEPAPFLSANFMYQTLDRTNHEYDLARSAPFVTGEPADGTQQIDLGDRLSIVDSGGYAHQKMHVFNWNVDVRLLGQRLSYVGSHARQIFYNLSSQDPGDYFNPATFPVTGRVFMDPAGARPACQENGGENGFQPSTLTYHQCVISQQTADTHEIRLQSDSRIGGMFDYVVGYFRSRTFNRSDITQETPVVNNLFGPPSVSFINLTGIIAPGHQKEESFFGNITAYIGDKTELSGGLRRIRFRDIGELDIAGNPVTANRDVYHATIFNASAKHRFSDDLMVYATVGSSWRPGIHVIGDFNPLRSARENSFINLQPEKSTSYELGFKASFLDHRATLNVSLYHQDFNGYIYRGPGVYYVNYTFIEATNTFSPTVSAFNFVSSVPVKVDGVEVEAGLRVNDRWSLGANFSWSNGRIRNGTVACNDVDRDGLPDIDATTPTVAQIDAAAGAGNNVAQCSLNSRASMSPKWNATLRSEYDLPVSAHTDGFLRGLLTYYPGYQQDPFNTLDDVKGYALVNLFAGLRSHDGMWELSFFAKNLLNTRRILGQGGNGFGGGSGPLTTTVQTFTGAINPQSSYYFATLNQPRELGVNLRIALGSR
jgi:iron complex outermembrane receptor protein